MKEIILPTEIMAFFILNMFAHDSALHDFTTSSALGKGRAISVLSSGNLPTPGSNSSTSTSSGKIWSGKGGNGDDELDKAVKDAYNNVVAPSLNKCLQKTGFFDTKRTSLQSDSFIIVDANLAYKTPKFTGTQQQRNITKMGIAPGFIYLPEKTYSPFEFVLTDIETSPNDSFTYTHITENWNLKISYIGEDKYNTSIIREKTDVTMYKLLSSDQALINNALTIISVNPDVTDAFLSNTTLSKITNYVDYIQLLLDGAHDRYKFMLTDYLNSGYMGEDKRGVVTTLLKGDKHYLTDMIKQFWLYFENVTKDGINDNFLTIMPVTLSKIETIQQNFALIYKAILCSVASGEYSCPPSLKQQISDKETLDKFYNDNKLELEMFVYKYIVSSQNFNEGQTQDIKDTCNKIIQKINKYATDQLPGMESEYIGERVTKLVNCQMIDKGYDPKTDTSNNILDQYPLTYFVKKPNVNKRQRSENDADHDVDNNKKIKIDYENGQDGGGDEDINVTNPEKCDDDNDIRFVKQLTTFTNFLQIVANTLISIETDTKEEEEQKENEIELLDNSDTNVRDKEASINILTDLQIISNNDVNISEDKQNKLIGLVQQTCSLLFGSDPITNSDYTTILTEAVGSGNVSQITKVLATKQLSENQLSQNEILLLQTVFLDLIIRLDSYQLKELINYCKGQNLISETIPSVVQLGGAKLTDLFVRSEAEKFFTEMMKQNRLTKVREKIKALFLKTDGVLPLFYTNLIMKPNDPSVLNWSLDFSNVFFGFFMDPNIPQLTNNSIQNSIDFGVIFPQISPTIIEDLTRDDIIPETFKTIENLNGRLEIIQKIENLNGSSQTIKDKFKAILDLTNNFNLPGIFKESDDGSSSMFWRFERGYVYLLKCVVLYGVLFLNEPLGSVTISSHGFSTDKLTMVKETNEKFDWFLLLFFSCTKTYRELLEKIVSLSKISAELSGQQKLCAGYALGSILTSVMTEMGPIISSLNKSALLSIETEEISRILTKKANSSTILQNSAFGDNDTKLYNKFLGWVENNFYQREGQREGQTSFNSNDGISGKLSGALSNAGWNGKLLKDIGDQYGGDKFYINNAVNAPSALGKLGRGYFCPAASIMDNQSTCSTKNSALANEGFEGGIMDFMIHDGREFGTQTGIPARMVYRVRVIPIGDGSTCQIWAYLSIDDKILINIADKIVSLPNGVTWPNLSNANPPIVVPMNPTRNGPIPIPMDAKTCLKNIFDTIASNQFQQYNNSNGFQSLIDDLGNLDNTNARPLRRLILEASFVKGLGDFLQEIAGIADNGGYEGIPTVMPKNNPPIIRLPNEGRLQLSNDRPSGVRAILFVLYGKKDINPNVIAGYLTEMLDKKKLPKSKYALASRMLIKDKTVGGIKSKKHKLSKKHKVSKKHKISKKNKTTRRIKMKTCVNKRSKRNKKM